MAYETIQTYQGYDRHQYERAFRHTMAMHFPEIEQNVFRAFALTALIQARGQVVMGVGGNGFDWRVQWRLPRVGGYTGFGPRTFNQSDLYKMAKQEWRGYEATAFIPEGEVKRNHGSPKMEDVLQRMPQELQEAMEQHLGVQIYIDGDDATTSSQLTSWHGLKSLFKTDGNTINNDGSGSRSANAADYVATPAVAGSYAGIYSKLGYYAGAQETDIPWPEGVADPEYDFWSGLIVQKDSSSFGSTKIKDAIRFGLTHSMRNRIPGGGQPDYVFIDRSDFIDFKEYVDGKEQVWATPADSELVNLGFKNTIRFDGAEVTMEHSMPVGEGFGINFGDIALLCCTDKMFDENAPVYDEDQAGFKSWTNTLSNLRIKRGPRAGFALKKNALI